MSEVTPAQAWRYAIRPKTLSVAIIPVIVGTSLAPSIDWVLAALMLFSAIFIQIGANLANDAGDFARGGDTEERLGFPRATQMGWLTGGLVMRGAYIAFFIAFLLTIPIALKAGFIVLLAVTLSILAGYAYVAGPYPYGYYGFGEIMTLLFFGYVCTSISYYIQTGTVGLKTLLAGTQVGLLSAAILAINNLRDIVGDTKAGKKTLAVRFGKWFGKTEITCCIIAPFLLNLYWAKFGYPIAAFLPLSLFVFAGIIVQGIWIREPGRIYNNYLVLTSFLMLLFGILLTIGIWLQ